MKSEKGSALDARSSVVSAMGVVLDLAWELVMAVVAAEAGQGASR